MRRKLVLTAVYLVPLLFLMMCLGPVDRIIEEGIYRIDINSGDEAIVYAPTHVEFDFPIIFPPDDIEIPVTNNWNQTINRLNVLLTGPDRDMFSFSPGRIDNLEPCETAFVTVKMVQGNPRRPTSYRAELLVGYEGNYQRLPITYHVCTFIEEEEIALTSTGLRAGITRQPTVLLNRPSGPGDWISFHPRIAQVNSNGFMTLHSGGNTVVGLLSPAADGYQIRGWEIAVLPAIIARTANDPADTGAVEVALNFSEPISAAGSITGLSADIFGIPLAIHSAFLLENNIRLILAYPIEFGDEAYIRYNASGNLRDQNGAPLEAFEADVINNVIVDAAVDVTRPYANVEASTEIAAFPVANAVDGNNSTRWATPTGANECTITLSYNDPIRVRRARIASYASRITRFNIEYSSNGTDWEVVYSYTDTPVQGSTDSNALVWVSFPFSPVTANHFRLRIINASQEPTLWEFQLWGSRP
ncbi:MAG: discoidin domain-containing protein [Treponema sp.]|nr:discoidin domain-containing protein [Treponema sp.]